jgi:hypothetical protein
MGDWLSGAESETILAFELFSRGLAGRAEVYGVSAADVAEVARLVAAAGEAMAAANSPATRTPIAIAAKQQAFADARVPVRRLAAFIRHNPNLSVADLAELGLKPKAEPRRVPAPTQTPMLAIRRIVPGGHEIDCAPLAAPKSGGKPAGAHGLELFVAYSPNHGGRDEPLGLDSIIQHGKPHGVLTRRVAAVIHADDRLGSMANYVGRWINRRGEAGPWSQPVRMLLVMPRDSSLSEAA